MLLPKCIALLVSLILGVKLCAGQGDLTVESLDCNCDVDIDIVKRVLEKLEKLEKRVEEIYSRKESTQVITATSRTSMPGSCLEATTATSKSGIYKIKVERFSETPFEVWCDQDSDFGGWTVIQRRVNAEVDFYRKWTDYKIGFGNLDGNYWIGLDKLHALTTSCEHELYIRMESFSGVKYYARYNLFVVGSEAEGYVLKTVGDYKGDASDYFKNHEGSKFSTYDRDNDRKDDDNCAKKWRGGWWYNCCYWSNLNGDYAKKNGGEGVVWIGISRDESLKFVQMMIRPTQDCMKRLSLKY
ncbi:fibrinogen C domain-containing protein 1-like isoform X1 [Bactrocera neohumeralis]|uniref:fibrinogen C domain-containing protein 1-like isoform X1 n=1 Tax=Bactrocera neohumeralis TaxID=98809 RepID=UPI002165B941|nr:fibrinogen C domain-containing protein 1-like isoform X1 [Bactrocera neohumeralis]